jgi:hypothetical protein
LRTKTGSLPIIKTNLPPRKKRIPATQIITTTENHPETVNTVFQLLPKFPAGRNVRAAKATCIALKIVLKTANRNRMRPK